MAKAMTQKAAPGLGLDADLARKLLRDMLLIRRFEEKAAEAYALGKIGGFLHLSIGEEAVAAGATSVLRPDDYAISTYREHGHCLIKGSDPRRVMAELFGRVDGLSKGKGGSMHLFDKEHNFLGGHAIVGAHLPIAAGVGFAIKYRGGDQVVLCYFGDGAVPEGEREKLRDPILLFRDRVLKPGVLSEDDVKKIEKDVNDLVDEAVAFADASPEPPASELFTDIFKESA